MFEVWEIVRGPGAGELFVAAVDGYGEMPVQLRRIRAVWSRAFGTEDEAHQFRVDFARLRAAAAPDPEGRARRPALRG
jgi:hypothetical protein